MGIFGSKLQKTEKQASKIAKELYALTISKTYSPKYFFIAKDLIKLAEQLQLPEEERSENYKGENLDSLIENIFPVNFNKELEDKKLLVQLSVLNNNLPPENPLAQSLFMGIELDEAAENILLNSSITSKENVIALAMAGPDSILNSDDPFINFILDSRDRLIELQSIDKKLDDSDVVNNQLLGEALYEIYGDAIPPDATGTLRISDGVIKGYEYNGTIAPVKTTFYGSLDRYYSFNKKFPFNLPDYWEEFTRRV